MLKQGQPPGGQEALTEYGSTLPHHLPQWARVNTLDKGRYPKAFLKDRLQPLPQLGGGAPVPAAGVGPIVGGASGMDPTMDSRQTESDHLLEDRMNPELRVQHLEKSLHFLRTQHQEVLANLHDEIDTLKRHNKELNFRIVMLQKSNSGSQASLRGGSASSVHGQQPALPPVPPIDVAQSPPSAGHQYPQAEGKVDEIKLIFLEEEVKELKRAVREEKNRNVYLTQLLETTEKEKQVKAVELEKVSGALTVAEAREAERKAEQGKDTAAGPLPYNATLQPLQVHLPAQPPRAPTTQECEIIIRHLQQVSDKQAHELNQLKCDLRDVLYSHKWTPDAYLLARAYIAADDERSGHPSQADATRAGSGRVQLKQHSKKLPDVAYAQREAVTLPPMRHGVGNAAVERRKRTQILQRARLKRPELGAIQQ